MARGASAKPGVTEPDAVYGSSVVAKPMLKATFSSTTLYYGIGPSTFDRSILLNVMVD
ncbi:hypothetical protein ONJ17_25880, partial [Salmonella enterica subsp. enterica serovar Agona]|nr:hypothetical protein [Salmonella enterica subsp. enterica serovar Agona]